ncbi:MAG: 6-phosphofructokinase [Bacteroidota bacterium]
MKKIGVFTSGGDAPGMNACIRAVVRTALHHGVEVVGIMEGYKGILEENFVPMTRRSVSNIIQQGGTILKSARSAEFRTKEGRKKAYENLKKAGIDGVVAIGGDGTFTGAEVFMKEFPDIKFVGCPGTIDNDLYGTDFTIGYDTAVNTAMEAIDKIKDTANADPRLFFIEVMGRDVGFIALRSGIATGAEAVLIPETTTSIKELTQTIQAHYDQKKSSVIVIVAEGDELGGAVKVAKKVSKKFTDLPARVTILGHIQRGGRPTAAERVNASWMGVEAVRALLVGKKGIMIGVVNNKVKHTAFKRAIKHNRAISPTLLEMVDILS